MEDILLIFSAKDNVSAATQGIKSNVSGIKLAAGVALSAASGYMLSFAKDAVNSAVESQTEWARFGSTIDSQGGSWSKQESSIKSWIGTFSNNMGRSIADTREASTTLMNYGMSWQQVQTSMGGIAGLAARTGKTESEAANMVTSALSGRGREFEKATGMELDNYKTADGTIDRMRLMNDLSKKMKPAANVFANTPAGKVQQLSNAMKSLKTSFGATLLDAIKPLIPVVTNFFKAINALPGPVKTAGFVMAGLAAGVGIIVGPLVSLIQLLGLFGVEVGSVTGSLGIWDTIMGVTTAEVSGLSAAEIGAASAHSGVALAVGTEETSYVGLQIAKARETIETVANTVAKDAAAISSAALAAVQGVLTGEITASAAAWMVLDAVMDANPITIILIAVVALAAGLYLLYTYCKPVHDAVNALGAALGKLGSAVGGAVMSGLQSLYKTLLPLFNVIGKVASVVGGALFSALSAVATVVGGVLVTAFNIFGAVISAPLLGLTALINVITGLITGQLTLGGIASSVWNSFSSIVGGALKSVTSIITSVGGSIVNGLRSAFTNGVNAAVTAVTGLAGRIWTSFMQTIQRVAQFDMQVRTKVKNIGKNILNGILNGLTTLPTRLWTYFLRGIQIVIQFASQAFSHARNAGNKILTGVIQFVTQLPGRLASFFASAVGRIAGFAGQAMSSAGQVGNAAITGVINYVSQIPGKVYNEFVKIGQKIHDAVSSAVSAATSFGQDIVSAVMGALNIASPGIIQRTIGWEFGSIAGRITEHASYAKSAASNFAKGIVSGFGNPALNVSTKFNNGLNDISASGVLNRKISTNGVNAATSGYNYQKSNSQTVNIQVHEGAMKLNAGNLNQKQCQQVLINALEGTQGIKKVIM